MNVEHLEVLVEEPSMEAALRILLPRIMANTSFAIHPYQGKQDLVGKLPNRLAGYKKWIPANYRILVVVDRDDDDCKQLKNQLEESAVAAGFKTKSTAHGSSFTVINRIVVEELEAWYFGDWEAVRAAYPGVGKNIPRNATYRNPDGIKGGTWEAFERVLQRAGYFSAGFRKIEAARLIAEHMVPERNTSPSFQALYSALVPSPENA